MNLSNCCCQLFRKISFSLEAVENFAVKVFFSLAKFIPMNKVQNTPIYIDRGYDTKGYITLNVIKKITISFYTIPHVIYPLVAILLSSAMVFLIEVNYNS